MATMRAEDVTDKLRVVDLRAELVKLGLETKGTKPVLIARLKEALESSANEGEIKCEQEDVKEEPTDPLSHPEPTDEGCHEAVEDAEAHMEKVRTVAMLYHKR